MDLDVDVDGDVDVNVNGPSSGALTPHAAAQAQSQAQSQSHPEAHDGLTHPSTLTVGHGQRAAGQLPQQHHHSHQTHQTHQAHAPPSYSALPHAHVHAHNHSHSHSHGVNTQPLLPHSQAQGQASGAVHGHGHPLSLPQPPVQLQLHLRGPHGPHQQHQHQHPLALVQVQAEAQRQRQQQQQQGIHVTQTPQRAEGGAVACSEPGMTNGTGTVGAPSAGGGGGGGPGEPLGALGGAGGHGLGGTETQTQEQTQEQEQVQAQVQAQTQGYGPGVPYPQTFQPNYSDTSPDLCQFPQPSGPVFPNEAALPAQMSAFSRWYTDNPVLELEDDPVTYLEMFAAANGYDDGAVVSMPYNHRQPALIMPPYSHVAPEFVNRGDGELMTHYITYVRPVQYFFLDKRVDQLLFEHARSYHVARDAMCFVASVHRSRAGRANGSAGGRAMGAIGPAGLLSGPPSPPIDDAFDLESSKYYEAAYAQLQRGRERPLTPGEAMAGLQCVSSYLFSGGVGTWDWFLAFACDWLEGELRARGAAAGGNVNARSALADLARRDELAGTIARMTMWFEVLASVTLVRPPRFMRVYREVFGSAGARVSAEGIDASVREDGLTMLEVMGCDNRTFLAIAEISALAAWKEGERSQGRLSNKELVRRGMEIEENHLEDSADHMDVDEPTTGDSLPTRRKLTAGVFRAAARLYLDTVLSEDWPDVPEIVEGVRGVAAALRRVPRNERELRKSVVRSAVFPLCLAGCMAGTTLQHERSEIREALLSEGGGAGNCAEAARVMEKVWEARARARARDTRGSGIGAEGGEHVSWRAVLRENGGVLLV